MLWQMAIPTGGRRDSCKPAASSLPAPLARMRAARIEKEEMPTTQSGQALAPCGAVLTSVCVSVTQHRVARNCNLDLNVPALCDQCELNELCGVNS